MNVTTAQREHTYARDLGRCARCGGADPLCSVLNVQHRIGRGMGGTSRPARASELLTLGVGCHKWTEEHPALADALGFSVPPGQDPATWPVRHHAWDLVLLNDDGGVTFL